MAPDWSSTRSCGSCPPQRARLGAEGPRRVGVGFLAEQMVAAYEGLYRAVLAERAAGRVAARPHSEKLA